MILNIYPKAWTLLKMIFVLLHEIYSNVYKHITSKNKQVDITKTWNAGESNLIKIDIVAASKKTCKTENINFPKAILIFSHPRSALRIKLYSTVIR